jgi:hypothetical protein
VLYSVYYFIQLCKFCLSRSVVKRRTSIKKIGDTRRVGRELNSNEISYSQMVSVFWQRKGYHMMVRTSRLFFLFVVVSLIMPLLIGLVFDLYVISPLQGLLHRSPIIFPILDWSTGAMTMRLLYNIQMMMPERPLARILTQAYNDGIDHMNLLKLTEEIFLPCILGCTGLLTFPILIRAIELHFSNIFLTKNFLLSF